MLAVGPDRLPSDTARADQDQRCGMAPRDPGECGTSKPSAPRETAMAETRSPIDLGHDRPGTAARSGTARGESRPVPWPHSPRSPNWRPALRTRGGQQDRVPDLRRESAFRTSEKAIAGQPDAGAVPSGRASRPGRPSRSTDSVLRTSDRAVRRRTVSCTSPTPAAMACTVTGHASTGATNSSGVRSAAAKRIAQSGAAASRLGSSHRPRGSSTPTGRAEPDFGSREGCRWSARFRPNRSDS